MSEKVQSSSTADPLNCRDRFLNACRCRPVDRPPIWMMRQAGRSLPEYRKLKEGRRFTEMVQDPVTAAEVTLQPIRRFGYDAAVIFSDILVVAEAMGQPYELLEQGGVKVDFQLNSAADVDRLDPGRVAERIGYTPDAIRLVRQEMGAERAIIGFAGSPWTLASFMVEGGSSKDNIRSRALLCNRPELFAGLLEKITEATVTYLKAQIEAGADVIQLFDSQGGTLAGSAFWEASGRWMQQIIEQLPDGIPTIVFSRGTHHNWKQLVQTGANVFGIDWSLRLRDVCGLLPDTIAVQGNLDPAMLTATPETAAAETLAILEEMRGRDGFIFNLGHGVPPEADLEAIQAVVQTVKDFS